MIKSDFYPTDTTTSGIEKTATITNLNLTDMSVDPLAAYYMGSVPNDKCLWYVPKKCTVDYNSNPMQSKLKLTNVDTAKLYWGYGALSDDGAAKTAWNETNSKYQSSMRLINSMYAYKLDTYGTVSIGIILRQYHDVTLESGLLVGTQIATMANAQGFTLTCSEYLDWVLNGTSLTVTFNEQEYEIKYNDFNSDGVNFLGTGIVATITSMSMGKQTAHESATIQYIFPFVSTQVGDRFYARCGVSATNVNDCRVQFKRDLSEIKIKESTGYSDIGLDGTDLVVINRGIEWEITGEFMDYVRRNGYTIPHYFLYSSAITCRYTGYSGSGSNTLYEFTVEPQYRPQDFWTLFCLINRYSLNSSRETAQEYTTNNTIALFNADNSPKLERQTFTTYREIENKLRDWQKYGYNINDDEFNPDQPTPPGGDDDPGSDDPVDTPLMTGDDQDLQTDRTMTAANDFITLYNITPPMLSIFGRTLWKSIADYDPQDPTSADIFKNFFAILNEEVTGTLDIGAILQFVVSVRQYPFNVAGMGITTSAGDSIKIGTGIYPISLGSGANVQKLTSTIGLIDCGSVTIADYKDFKLYNDFRDYLNATVTAFLPYCGSVELNPIEVIHNTVHCYYAIDFYTGECTAYITTTDGNHTVLSAIKNGSIGVLVPITATNSGQISARHMSDNAKDAGLIVSNLGNLFGAVANAAQGNIAGFGSSILGIAQNSLTQKQMQAERQGRSAVLAPSLSGGSGAAAFYQPSCPSIVVRRGTYARQKINNYPQTCAYPSTTSGTLKSFHGYTECYNVNVSGLNCTEEERAAVKSILESGCYLP